MKQTEARAHLDSVLGKSRASREMPDAADLFETSFPGMNKEDQHEYLDRFRKAFCLGPQEVFRALRGRIFLPAEGRCEFEALVPDGWFNRYLEWTKEHESPAQYHFGSAITVCAAGFVRRPRILWEARPLYPNIYALIVGPTGARKGAAIDRAVRLVQRGLGTYVLPTEGTHQGFAEALRRRLGSTGGEFSEGLIVAPEFSVLLSKDKHKEDLYKWLTDWYDSPDKWERALRGEEYYELCNVTVSVLGGSNMALLKTVPTDAITSGFFPRFILFDAADKRFWKARPRFDKDLEEELVKDLKLLGSVRPETIGFDGESGRYLDHWYEHEIKEVYEASTDELFQAWLARKQAAAMKLAAVWQIVDGGPTDNIRLKWLKQAREVVDWGDTSVEKIYGALGTSAGGQISNDVLDVLKRLGGTAPRTSVVRRLRNKYNAAQIDAALGTLRAGGEITQKMNDSMSVYTVRR